MNKEPRKRSKTLSGVTLREKVCFGKMWLYATINHDEQGIRETLGALGKSGSCHHHWMESMTKMTTLALKYGAPVEEVIKKLSHISCPCPTIINEETKESNMSCADAFSRLIKSYLEEKAKETKNEKK